MFWLRRAENKRTKNNPLSPQGPRFFLPIKSSKHAKLKAKKRRRAQTRSFLEVAKEWQALLSTPEINSRADLARHLGLSRARVTQVLVVYDVPVSVREAVVKWEGEGKWLSGRKWLILYRLGELEGMERLRGWGIL